MVSGSLRLPENIYAGANTSADGWQAYARYFRLTVIWHECPACGLMFQVAFEQKKAT